MDFTSIIDLTLIIFFSLVLILIPKIPSYQKYERWWRVFVPAITSAFLYFFLYKHVMGEIFYSDNERILSIVANGDYYKWGLGYSWILSEIAKVFSVSVSVVVVFIGTIILPFITFNMIYSFIGYLVENKSLVYLGSILFTYSDIMFLGNLVSVKTPISVNIMILLFILVIIKSVKNRREDQLIRYMGIYLINFFLYWFHFLSGVFSTILVLAIVSGLGMGKKLKIAEILRYNLLLTFSFISSNLLTLLQFNFELNQSIIDFLEFYTRFYLNSSEEDIPLKLLYLVLVTLIGLLSNRFSFFVSYFVMLVLVNLVFIAILRIYGLLAGKLEVHLDKKSSIWRYSLAFGISIAMWVMFSLNNISYIQTHYTSLLFYLPLQAFRIILFGMVVYYILFPTKVRGNLLSLSLVWFSFIFLLLSFVVTLVLLILTQIMDRFMLLGNIERRFLDYLVVSQYPLLVIFLKDHLETREKYTSGISFLMLVMQMILITRNKVIFNSIPGFW